MDRKTEYYIKRIKYAIDHKHYQEAKMYYEKAICSVGDLTEISEFLGAIEDGLKKTQSHGQTPEVQGPSAVKKRKTINEKLVIIPIMAVCIIGYLIYYFVTIYPVNHFKNEIYTTWYQGNVSGGMSSDGVYLDFNINSDNTYDVQYRTSGGTLLSSFECEVVGENEITIDGYPIQVTFDGDYVIFSPSFVDVSTNSVWRRNREYTSSDRTGNFKGSYLSGNSDDSYKKDSILPNTTVSSADKDKEDTTDMGKTCSICGKTETEVLFLYDTDHICVGCADQNQENDWNNEGSHSGVGADISFEEALQQSKYWSMKWYDSGALYSACFGFEESGTCYMLLNAGFEILSTGIGSYRVDGNEVSIDIVLDGESNYSYDFQYDQKTGTFIQTSNKGIAYNHNAGDQFVIETADITVAGKMQEIFGSSLPSGHDDSNDPVATDPPATKPAVTEPPATKPTATKPAATEPPATKPAATKPVETKPSATQGPTQCPHEYTFATCTEPQTCVHCGDTIGDALGHAYSDATCTAPETCTRCGQESGRALGHSWTAITETIHYEEQGHYEEQQDAVEVQLYQCPMCSYSQPDYATLGEYYAHFDSEHGDDPTSGFLREAYELVDDWVYETVTVWVVDQEEYTETVVVGQECENCGEIEEY